MMKQKRFVLALASVFFMTILCLGSTQAAVADEAENEITIAQLISMIEHYEQDGAFTESAAARALKTHLTAIHHFEQQGHIEKAIEHMPSFQVLIDSQLNSEFIMVDAYDNLKTYANSVMDVLQRNTPEPLAIVSNGQANAVIVKPIVSGSEINEATRALSEYIKRATGIELPIYMVDELAELELAPSTIMIRVGEGSYSEITELTAELEELHADGFIIAPIGNELIITSRSLIGTRNGVYAFLEKYVGVTWLFPGEEWTDVPQTEALFMPTQRWMEEPTTFTLRRSMNMSERFYGDIRHAWQRQNRVVSANEIKIGHNIYNIFPIEKYGDTEKYPDFYPNNRPPAAGSHAGWQPCYSNPATVEVAVDHIKEYFANNPKEASFSLAVNDSDGFCEMDPEHPGYPENPTINSVGRLHMSEIYYQWVNEVVAGVTEEYPDKWFALYAYHAVIDPPAFDLHPRAIPVVTKDRLAWVDPDVEAQGKSHFDAWKERATVLGWYDYMLGSVYSAPRVYPHLVEELYEYAMDQNVQLHHWDMHPILGDGPQPWIISKLGWSMDQDVDALLDHWYETAVGPEAADDLKAYYELWEQFWETKARESSWFELSKYQTYLSLRNSSYLAYAKDEIEQSRPLLESVLAKAQTPEQKIRAEQLLHQFEYYESSALSYPSQIDPPNNDEEALAILHELDQTLEDRLYMANRRLELVEEYSSVPALRYPLDPTVYNETWTGWSQKEFWHIKHYLDACDSCEETGEIAHMLQAFQKDVSRPKLRNYSYLLNEIDIHRSLTEDASFEETDIPTWNKWNPYSSAVIDITNEQSFSGEHSLRYENATLAGVWKYVDVTPGLLASNVQFYTPTGTMSQGEVQIVIELHTGEDKLVYYSEAKKLADHAGEWTEISFFEDMPAQINGKDIQNILINTQIRNAGDAIVYLDDLGVYQVQYGVADLLDIIHYFLDEGKLTSVQAQSLQTFVVAADAKYQENEIPDYLGLLADLLAEVEDLKESEALNVEEADLLANEVHRLFLQFMSVTLEERTFYTSDAGTLQVPLTIENRHAHDLTFELSGMAEEGVELDFPNSITVPANQSVTTNGTLTIPVNAAEENYFLPVQLRLNGKNIWHAGIEVFHSRNLLSNPGFEQSGDTKIASWDVMNNGLATGEVSITSDAYSGSSALKLLKEDTSRDARVKQMVEVIGGETYELSAWLKSAVTAPGRVQMKVEFYRDVTGAEGIVGEINGPAYGTFDEWEEVTFEMVVPEEANLAVIHLRVYGPGTAYFDDVSFEKVELAVDPNVLINPGFEDLEGSQIVGWQAMNNGLITGDVSVSSEVYRSGANGLKLTRTASSGDARVRQLVNVTGGETYELSAWLKSAVTAPGRVQMKVEFYRDVTGIEGHVDEINSPTFGSFAEWEEVKFQMEVPEEANLAIVHLRVFGPGTAYFDDVLFKTVE